MTGNIKQRPGWVDRREADETAHQHEIRRVKNSLRMVSVAVRPGIKMSNELPSYNCVGVFPLQHKRNSSSLPQTLRKVANVQSNKHLCSQ